MNNPQPKRMHCVLLGIGISLLSYVIDQASKYYILSSSIAESGKEILPFLDLTLVWNRGISYGLMADNSELGNLILTGAITIIFILMAAWMIAARNIFLSITLAMIVGGAAGNLTDRIMHGAVVDFIHFHIGNWSWYVFNIADALIVVGAVSVAINSMLSTENELAKDQNTN